MNRKCPNCKRQMVYWYHTIDGYPVYRCVTGCRIPLIVNYSDKKEKNGRVYSQTY
jgi:hypothetical protein